MLSLRKTKDRGHFNHGWLDTCHTFSFADCYDPGQIGFSVLRVIDDDTVVPGKGFSTPDAATWRSSPVFATEQPSIGGGLGTGSVIRPGEIQRLSDGSGITHCELNHSKTEPVHVLQIWILPDRSGLIPGMNGNASSPRNGRRSGICSPLMMVTGIR